MSDAEHITIDLTAALGATAGVSVQTLTLYIPDRDRQGREIGNQRRWVLEAAEVLARIGGGVTIEPPVEGGWNDEVVGHTVWERPVVVFTHVQPTRFIEALPDLRRFLHRMGQETGQGEVALEFENEFFRIQDFAP